MDVVIAIILGILTVWVIASHLNDLYKKKEQIKTAFWSIFAYIIVGLMVLGAIAEFFLFLKYKR